MYIALSIWTWKTGKITRRPSTNEYYNYYRAYWKSNLIEIFVLKAYVFFDLKYFNTVIDVTLSIKSRWNQLLQNIDFLYIFTVYNKIYLVQIAMPFNNFDFTAILRCTDSQRNKDLISIHEEDANYIERSYFYTQGRRKPYWT